ncbi:hypothetical protein QC761_0065040 [Podospora bellae-mahoneyi]|uniref:Uncharacterized protein n=1 Tax=Podospora bellae-mahoneyi TaxID=2093777 RepID=A0ABR0FIA2_9PEZI|nr:hypothetical protein QC761_0065040 [Podospora bellae-mahoneyi]
MNNMSIKQEADGGSNDRLAILENQYIEEYKRRRQQSVKKASHGVAVQIKPMYDRLKMATQKAEKEAEEVGSWDKELREVKEKILRLDEKKAQAMNYKKTVEQKRTRLLYSITDSQALMESGSRAMNSCIADQYAIEMSTQPSSANGGARVVVDIDCLSLEDFTPRVKSHVAYMDFCTDMVLRPADLGTAKAEASRAGTPSLTPDYNISVPGECTSTARPRTGAEPPSGEESLRQVSQLTLNLLCPISFSPEQRPADLTTTAAEAPPAGTSSQSSKSNSSVAKQSTSTVGRSNEHSIPASAPRNLNIKSFSLPTLRFQPRSERSAIHDHQIRESHGPGASGSGENLRLTKRMITGLRRSISPSRPSLLLAQGVSEHESGSESEHGPTENNSPPTATVVAAAASNPWFEHNKDGKVSYIGEKALRGIYHGCIRRMR